MSKTREEFPLSTKKIVKKTLVATIGWIVLLIFGFIFIGIFAIAQPSVLGGSFILILFVLFIFLAVIILLTYLYQKWYFDFYFYDLTADYIIIKKGPITPREITIPYERIQDVYVDQDLFDRILGIYDVHLSSATVSSGMEAHIDGVEKLAADGLRAQLLQTISAKIGKTKSPVTTPESPKHVPQP